MTTENRHYGAYIHIDNRIALDIDMSYGCIHDGAPQWPFMGYRTVG